jgi:hypothetical protein
MQKITCTATLKTAIQELESQQAIEWTLLENQFRTTFESFKLSNIIKNTFKKAISAPGLKSNILTAALGLSTGMVTKNLLIGKTINPLKKLLGVVVEMFVANKVVDNADGLKSFGSRMLSKLGNTKADQVNG